MVRYVSARVRSGAYEGSQAWLLHFTRGGVWCEVNGERLTLPTSCFSGESLKQLREAHQKEAEVKK